MKATIDSAQKSLHMGAMLSHKFQRQGAFIVPLPIDKRKMMIKKSSQFSAPLTH
jgi:hypothetical protein